MGYRLVKAGERYGESTWLGSLCPGDAWMGTAFKYEEEEEAV